MAGRPADHLDTRGAALQQRLGSRLRERRLALGHTLADVASEAEISVSYLSAVEKGTNMPSLPVLGRLVHALRLTLHELLREDDRVQVRVGEIAIGDVGVRDLDHSDLRLRVSSLVSEAGDRGEAPVPVVDHAVFVFVDRGALVVEVDGMPYALGAGDALDVVDIAELRWQTLGEDTALSLWGSSRPRTRAGR
jgi:transcriptional regulator with XRE-family HTH domain